MTASLLELFRGLPDDLRLRALTHSSWVDDRTDSWGRLAFLGDSVLGLAVAREFFRSHPSADIGDLTKMRNRAVSGESCAEVARELGLDDLMVAVAPGDGSGTDTERLLASERALASVCEAVIGACFLEYGFDDTSAATVEAFRPRIDAATVEQGDPKTDLQEALARKGQRVSYRVIGESGPAHDPRFEMEAVVDGERVGKGEGHSKKEAEQAAAREALEALGE